MNSTRLGVRIAKGSAVNGLSGSRLISDYLCRVKDDAVDTFHRTLATQSHVAIAEQSMNLPRPSSTRSSRWCWMRATSLPTCSGVE